ncbi:unnamed protein product [Calicophoron daubneyi]|uniref:Uncharacterized protein n=1 Tax=Calicophoron daubneyi TaxID=300641 RepID=A0AAV2TPU1_CALDB
MPRKVARQECNGATEQTLQLELEGFSPREDDSDGIAILLHHIFPDGSAVSAKDLANYIVSHNTVGTVVKPAEDESEEEEDEEDPQEIVFGLTTVVDLSLGECEKHAVVKHIRDFLLDIIHDSAPSSKKDGLIELFGSSAGSRIFLLLNERFENLPLSICAEAVSSLPSELKEAKLTPTHFLLLSRAFRSESSIEYAYPEYEHIRPFSLFDLEAPVKAASVHSDDDCNTYVVLVIKIDRFPEVLDALRAHL